MFKSWLKVIASLLLLLVGLAFSINYILHYMVNNKLTEIINYKDPNHLYRYTFSKVHIDVWAGDIEICDVNITPRKNIIDRLTQQGHPKRIVLEGSLNTIKVKNLNVYRLLMDREVSIDSFLLIRPNLNVYLNTKIKDDTSATFAKDLISQTLTYGKINFLSLEHAKLQWIGVNKDSSVYFSCDSVSLLVKNLYTDSSIIKKNEPVLFTELLFNGKKFHLNTIKDCSLESKHISFCYSKNQLELDEVVFKNTLNKIAFTKKQRYEKEWFHVDIQKISLSTPNTLHWVEGGYLNINKLKIDRPHMLVYKDKRLSDPPFVEKHLPSYLVRSIPFPLLIDTIEINHGRIRYQEIVTTGKTPGEVKFTQLYLKAYHFTNIDSLLKKYPFFMVSVSTMFLDKAPINIHFKFPIQNHRDKFYVEGTIKNLEAYELNNLLSNMAFVEFKKGYIHALSFHLVADKDSAIGTLDAHYTNLHINMLDTAELFHHNKHKRKKFIGTLANTLLKKNNIPNTKHYVQGKIHVARPKNKSIFNYLWTSVKSGLITTAINPKLYNKLMNIKEHALIKDEHKKKRRGKNLKKA